jgi:hypothetical protein
MDYSVYHSLGCDVLVLESVDGSVETLALTYISFGQSGILRKVWQPQICSLTPPHILGLICVPRCVTQVIIGTRNVRK